MVELGPVHTSKAKISPIQIYLDQIYKKVLELGSGWKSKSFGWVWAGKCPNLKVGRYTNETMTKPFKDDWKFEITSQDQRWRCINRRTEVVVHPSAKCEWRDFSDSLLFWAKGLGHQTVPLCLSLLGLGGRSYQVDEAKNMARQIGRLSFHRPPSIKRQRQKGGNPPRFQKVQLHYNSFQIIQGGNRFLQAARRYPAENRCHFHAARPPNGVVGMQIMEGFASPAERGHVALEMGEALQTRPWRGST